jgi:hypothetical protein
VVYGAGPRCVAAIAPLLTSKTHVTVRKSAIAEAPWNMALQKLDGPLNCNGKPVYFTD